MMIDKIRVGVLMGGVSSERQVSLKSGKAVLEAFKFLKIEAVPVDIQKENRQYVKDLLLSYDLGLAFLALHGSFGEDGKIQAILEDLGLAYTGSGPQASSLAMDKLASRKVFEENGLNVPRYLVLDKFHKRLSPHLSFPLVVKPVCGGSSIGLSIVDNPKELRLAVDLAFKYDRKVMVEEYVEGREMTVGILENMPLEAIEIKTQRRFFDYRAKYEDGQTEYVVPAQAPLEITRLLKSQAVKAHSLLGCFFFSRVDIILSRQDRPFILEVNTIPGFTASSLLPKAALQKGISFPELILKIAYSAWVSRGRSSGIAPLASARGVKSDSKIVCAQNA